MVPGLVQVLEGVIFCVTVIPSHGQRGLLDNRTTTNAPARGNVWWIRALQTGVLVGAGYYLLGVAAPHWSAIRGRDFAWLPGPLLLSALLVFLTLGVLLAAWTASLHWCAAPIRYRHAARIWFTTNLARFIPGTVWQFASLAALSSQHGVPALAATATVLLEQVVLLLTGLLVLAVFTPAVLHATWWQTALIVAAGLGALALALPRPGGRLGHLLERWVPGLRLLWSGVTPARLLLFTMILVVPWLLYGVAFRLLAVALLGSPPGSWGFYVAAFTGSYIAGVIAVFAPAGLLVREAALIGVLSPVLGTGDAVILAAASRIWLTALELVGAVIVLSLPAASPDAVNAPEAP